MAIVSDLAPEIVDLILARLPLRDAARASTVCVAWGRCWRDLSDLDFASSVCDGAAIDAVLSCHPGPVRRARLDVTDDGLLAGVQGWVETLSARGLESLDLAFSAQSVPSSPLMIAPLPCGSVLSCRALKHLVFTRCVLPAFPPPAASPDAFLPSLTRLRVTCSRFRSGSDLEAMVSAPPKLEEIRMSCVFAGEDGAWHPLQMESSSLRLLEIHGYGNVQWVAARLPRVARAKFVDAHPDSVANLLRAMESSVEELEYTNYGLPRVPLPKQGLPSSYKNLWRLEILVDFNNAPEISSVIYLLSSAPNLTQLVVQEFTYGSVEGVSLHHQLGCGLAGSSELLYFPRLRFLHMGIIPKFNAISLLNGLDFIRLVLSKARVLQTVVVEITKETQRIREIKDEIRRYDRVSPEARIRFKYSQAFLRLIRRRDKYRAQRWCAA